jgi:hypothetical protein
MFTLAWMLMLLVLLGRAVLTVRAAAACPAGVVPAVVPLVPQPCLVPPGT